jgi:hypothetical protein
MLLSRKRKFLQVEGVLNNFNLTNVEENFNDFHFSFFFFYFQVVRAASPVLLRFITLGAFFIYCTVRI